MNSKPPRFATRFLRWFCREDFLDEIEGDITELYEKHYRQAPSRARLKFVLTVIRYFRPEYLKFLHHRHPKLSSNSIMVRNYFNFAFRSLKKRAMFSVINIAGLAMGVCACLIILRYIDFETSFDKFHHHASSIYRINRIVVRDNDQKTPNVWTTYGLGPALQTDIPEVMRYIRTHTDEAVVSYHPRSGAQKAFHEGKILIADSTFFRAFTFRALEGNLVSSLDKPNSIVVTQSAARKYFGNADPVGETLTIAGGRMNGPYIVTAVMEDVPENSHFDFDFLMPLHNIFLNHQYRRDDGWGSNNFVTYVQLYDEAKYVPAEQKLRDFCKRRLDPKWKAYNLHFELRFQPLREIHFNTGLLDYLETVRYDTLYFFALIAGFILFIAWINYINLSTARAMERAREVGIRKSIGAFRSELITQFLVEAVTINFIGIVLAMALATLLLPLLGNIIGKELRFDLGDVRLWFTLGALFIAGSLASGMYPAFVMSSFRVTSVLKGQIARSGGYSLRKALVVFQFAASLILISGTFVVYRQIRYMQSQDKGLTMDQMLVVKGPGTIKWNEAKQKLGILKEEVKKIPGVKSTATSGAVPGGGHNWGADVRKNGTELSEIKLGSVVWIDPDFIPLYNINLLAGRNFDTGIRSDMEAVIINEASLKAFDLGTPEQALQQKLIMDGDTAEIIGVLKDYNWSSLRSEITPMIFMADTIVPEMITFHLEAQSIPSAIEAINNVFQELIPEEPFEYNFLDDSFNAQYKNDLQFGRVFGLFASLAVAISCLGLWGLASFTTAQRLKEIGVRKVLGATTHSIVYLLSGQFLKLVLIASLITLPLAWYGINGWLNGFAFRIDLQWDLLVIPVFILLVIALLTVSVQVLRGANANPATILKSE